MKKKLDKVSIIVPVYNSEEFIPRCLDSLINQTYDNIEIICINDGSTDESLKILNKYKNKDKRIKIINKENAGVSAARNDGLNIATGDYISFVDADDWLEANAIETLYNTLLFYNVDVVRGNYYINHSYTDNKNIKTGEQYNLKNRKLFFNESDFGSLFVDRLLNGQLPCFIWLLLIKRELLKNIRFKENIKYMEDVLFYNELINNINSIYILDTPIYHYFDNQFSCTRSKDYYIRNMYNIIDVNKELTNIISKGLFYSEDRIRLINTRHIDLIMNYFYQMYKENLKNNKDIVFEIDKIMTNNDLNIIFKNINLNYLPYHKRISIKLILKKNYKFLFRFYNARVFMSKFKK